MKTKRELLENKLRTIVRRIIKEETGKWRADVAGTHENVWSNNAIEYDTEEEVKKWLDGLKNRWFGYDMARVVPASTPRREKIDKNDPTIYQNFRS